MVQMKMRNTSAGSFGPLAEVLCLGCRDVRITVVKYAHLCVLCSGADLSLLQRSAEFSVALSKRVRSLF